MQEKLLPIYKKLKAILKKYEKHFTPKFDLDSKYDLWSIKDVVIDGRKKKEVHFASLIIQSSYVGFYFMPVEVEQHDEIFDPELLKLLKGISCFHIKSIDKKTEKHVANALKNGYKLYKKNDWV